MKAKLIKFGDILIYKPTGEPVVVMGAHPHPNGPVFIHVTCVESGNKYETTSNHLAPI